MELFCFGSVCWGELSLPCAFSRTLPVVNCTKLNASASPHSTTDSGPFLQLCSHNPLCPERLSPTSTCPNPSHPSRPRSIANYPPPEIFFVFPNAEDDPPPPPPPSLSFPQHFIHTLCVTVPHLGLHNSYVGTAHSPYTTCCSSPWPPSRSPPPWECNWPTRSEEGSRLSRLAHRALKGGSRLRWSCPSRTLKPLVRRPPSSQNETEKQETSPQRFPEGLSYLGKNLSHRRC